MIIGTSLSPVKSTQYRNEKIITENYKKLFLLILVIFNKQLDEIDPKPNFNLFADFINWFLPSA